MLALTSRQEKEQGLRMRRLALAVTASAATVLVAMLLAWAGYLRTEALAVYAGIVAACVAAFTVLFRTHANLRFADATLTVPQLVAAGLAVTYLTYETGSVRAVAMAMYLMAFIFGMFTLSLRGMVALGTFYIACYASAVGLTAALHPEALDGKREIVRAAGFTILLVCITLLSEHVNGLRRHLRDTNRELQDALERSQWIAGLSSDWYWEQDAEFSFTRIDGGLERLFGIDPGSLIGKKRWEVGYSEFGEDFWANHKLTLERHEAFRDLELVRRDADGTLTHAALISGEPVVDERGAFKGYRGVGRDITERKRMEEMIARMAAYDELTALPNARYLATALAKAAAEAQRRKSTFCVLYCDLDEFKPVNDLHGHAAGDLLLREVAARLRKTMRESDLVARLGGDEFVVVATTCATPEDARRSAERIHAALHRPFRIGNEEARVSCSIGIALYPDNGDNGAALLAASDRAMYAAKRAGRGRYAMADASEPLLAK